MPQDKLEPKFDPIWQSDMLDLRKMSSKAFILRQMYRLYRNPETNICNLSEYQIRAITRWDREAIRKAKRQLITLGEIIPQGSFSFYVKPFKQFKGQKTDGKTVHPGLNNQAENPSKVGGETAYHQAENPSGVGGKSRLFQSHPESEYTESERKNFNKDSKKTVNKSGGNSDWHCNDCANYDSHHVDSRGNTAGYCVTLKMSCPPYTFAGACAHFKNFFAPGVENNQEKVDKSQKV